MKKGFTLIELLVVIFIIGLLASIVVVSVNTARVKSRDARRIADMDTMRSAIEMYIDANGAPPGLGGTATTNSTSWNTTLRNLLTPTYLSALPVDPRNSATYQYVYTINNPTTPTDYKIYASAMESSDGGTRAANDGGNKNSCGSPLPTNGTCAYELFSSGGQNL
jgi:type II secretion system protein G